MSNLTKGMTSINRYGAFRASLAMSKPQAADNFANGTSAVYVDHLYEQWKADPATVHGSWRAYFEGVEQDAAEPYQAPPTLGQQGRQTLTVAEIMGALGDI
jgi:2-oxoglutarate dehydrogenase E1 component